MKAHQDNYKRLLSIIPDIETFHGAKKLKSRGYMDLNVDLLESTPAFRIIALSHYYKHPSGDMIADPDMEIKIDLNSKRIEALAYQDLYGHRRVYPKEGFVNPREQRNQNAFLTDWLKNLKRQGHKETDKIENGSPTA